jgi:hypothetical protein
MLAALDGGSHAERHHRQSPAHGAVGVDALYVVPAIHGGGFDSEPASVSGIDQRGSEHRFVRARRLDLPGNRKPGDGADGGVEAVSVEPAALPSRDSRAVAPMKRAAELAQHGPTGRASTTNASGLKWGKTDPIKTAMKHVTRLREDLEELAGL